LESIAMTELQRNQDVAERICKSFRADGQSFRPGQCIALLDGKVVALADDLEAVLKTLRSLEPDPSRGMVFEVGPPVVDVIR
jgi:hypothetical protein